MKITYQPLPENGPTIEKYGYFFNAGDTVEITDPIVLKRMSVLPFFREVIEENGIEVLPKKRGRPKRDKN